MSELLVENTLQSVIKDRKYGSTSVAVTQNYENLVARNTAFYEWANRLKPGECLPRGRYFNGLKKK